MSHEDLKRELHSMLTLLISGVILAFNQRYSGMEIFLRRLKSLNILPVPSTTEERGSFARVTGKPVSSRIRLSKFLSIDPPPVKTIPLSTISPEFGRSPF